MKTPVSQNGLNSRRIVDSESQSIAVCDTKEQAAELVRIVNAHEKLVSIALQFINGFDSGENLEKARMVLSDMETAK